MRGIVGDRLWSVRTPDNKIGSGKTSRRFAAVLGLLELRASIRDGRVIITFPDGSTCAVDDPDVAHRLSESLGRPVTVASETDVMHFDDGPISLVGGASVAALSAARGATVDATRFRPNVVLDTATAFMEDEWVGRRLRIGTVTLEVTVRSPRCVMVDMKTADLPAQPGNLLAAGRLNNACVGVIADVVEPGRLAVGDELTLL